MAMVCLKKGDWTEKIVLFIIYMWNAWYKIMSSSRLKKNCARFYHTPVILWEGHKILPLGAKYFVRNNLQKGKNWKFISLNENKLACFTNS